MALSIIVSAAFTIYVLRLEQASYGVLQAVLSVLFLLQAARGAIASYIVLFSEKDENALPHAINNAINLSVFIGTILIAAFTIFAPVLRDFLHLSSTLPFILIGVSVIPNIIGGIGDGILNVRKQFVSLALITPIIGIARIIAAIALFSDGFQEADVGWIIVIGDFVGLAPLAFVRLSFLHEKISSVRWIQKVDAQRIGTLFSTSLLFGFAQRIDVLWARHILSPIDAGSYSMMLGIAMMVYFITSGVARVATAWQRSAAPEGVLKASYIIIIGTATFLTTGFILIGERALFFLTKKEILIDWTVLMPLFIAMTCFSIIALDYSSFNVLTKRIHAGMAVLLVVMQAASLYFFTSSAESIAWMQCIVMTSLMGIFSIALWRFKRRNGSVSRAHPAELHLQHHM